MSNHNFKTAKIFHHEIREVLNPYNERKEEATRKAAPPSHVAGHLLVRKCFHCLSCLKKKTKLQYIEKLGKIN